MDVDEAERAAAPSVPVRLATGLAPSTSSTGATEPSEECEKKRRSKDSTSEETTAKKPLAEDSRRAGAPGAAVVSDQPQKDDTAGTEKTEKTEQTARDGTTEATPASALSDDLDNDETTAKKRLADRAAVTDELALRTLNVRGLSARRRQYQLRHIFLEKDLDVIAVQETKIESEELTDCMAR
ncbi:hypothetical protein HPB47_019604 [Ixodes persulcatus]|uniref:Uncharacterized protein n=1 Tax=Ixodes persulcatus TaxID=34615 RepID=A0AC60QK03_IXOPE|nr:hypothetical protein HPB47_019604 [Ixodes persulcatus]